MKDKQSLMRDFLWQEARRRRHWMKGTGVPNGMAIARDLGVSQPTISRVLNLVRANRPDDPKRPGREYQPKAELERALQTYFGFRHLSDLYDALANAEGAAPPLPRPTKRHR
ncbi:MAG TPA: hypothetical protein VFT98_20235 [Myxococcota bacterium]|nr:hypothetical protein [Myxococcota bacterium]